MLVDSIQCFLQLPPWPEAFVGGQIERLVRPENNFRMSNVLRPVEGGLVCFGWKFHPKQTSPPLCRISGGGGQTWKKTCLCFAICCQQTELMDAVFRKDALAHSCLVFAMSLSSSLTVLLWPGPGASYLGNGGRRSWSVIIPVQA
jgi:hypothetical protein